MQVQARIVGGSGLVSHAQERGLDPLFVWAERHAHVRRRCERGRLALRIAELFEEVRGTPRRVARASKFGVNAAAARRRMRRCLRRRIHVGWSLRLSPRQVIQIGDGIPAWHN